MIHRAGVVEMDALVFSNLLGIHSSRLLLYMLNYFANCRISFSLPKVICYAMILIVAVVFLDMSQMRKFEMDDRKQPTSEGTLN